MGEITLQRRLARLSVGLFLTGGGVIVAWKSHDLGLGIFASRLLAGVGGFVAIYGLMWVLGSGVLARLMLIGGTGFFAWSLWAVLSGGGGTDIAELGLWCGPLLGVIGLLFISPLGRSKASDSGR